MKRPTVATVFGVLSVIFGIISCISSIIVIIGIAVLINLGMIVPAIFAIGGVLVSILLLISGLFLLLNKKSSVTANILYATGAILINGGSVIYSAASGAGFGFMGILGFIYPVLIIIFIVRNVSVRSYYA